VNSTDNNESPGNSIFFKFQIKIPTSRIGKFSVFKSEEKSLGIKSDEKLPGFKSEEELSRPDLDSQEPRSCPQDLAITSTCEQLSNDDDGRSEKELGDHPNDTTASENIEKTKYEVCTKRKISIIFMYTCC
jgi:hypothetical protein